MQTGPAPVGQAFQPDSLRPRKLSSPPVGQAFQPDSKKVRLESLTYVPQSLTYFFNPIERVTISSRRKAATSRAALGRAQRAMAADI